MAVPSWQKLLLPTLRAGAHRTIRVSDAASIVADDLRLSADDRAAVTSNGRNLVQSRLIWAVCNLSRAKLVHRPRRGHYYATTDGLQWLESGRELSLADLKTRPAYIDHAPSSRDKLPQSQPAEHALDATETPEERVVAAEREAVEALKSELLDILLGSDPAKLEQVVIDLMLAMGFGGGGSAEHVGKTADGGIDGIINEDALGLEVIYLQAKRYADEHVIGVEKIREFAGVLDEKGVTKGVFVTTSRFAKPALQYAESSPKRIILLDGDALAEKMIECGVGVRAYLTTTLMQVDAEYLENIAPASRTTA